MPGMKTGSLARGFSGAVMILLMTACGSPQLQPAAKGGSPRPGSASTPCPDVPLRNLTGAPGRHVSADPSRPVRVGVKLQKGAGEYFLRELRVDVLPPSSGEIDWESVRSADAIPVRRLAAYFVSADDREFGLMFDGRDEDGNALPSGSYPVVVLLNARASTNAPCGRGALGPRQVGLHALLVTVDWTA